MHNPVGMIPAQYRLNVSRSSREGSMKFFVIMPSAIRSITERRTKSLWGAWCVARADQRFWSLSVRRLLDFAIWSSIFVIPDTSRTKDILPFQKPGSKLTC